MEEIEFYEEDKWTVKSDTDVENDEMVFTVYPPRVTARFRLSSAEVVADEYKTGYMIKLARSVKDTVQEILSDRHVAEAVREIVDREVQRALILDRQRRLP